MNELFILGVIIGCGLGGGYLAARRAVADRVETLDRTPKRRLPGLCVDCGELGVDVNLHCVTCGSDSVWTPRHGLPKEPTYQAIGRALDDAARDSGGDVEPNAAELAQRARRKEIADRVKAKHRRVAADSKEVS